MSSIQQQFRRKVIPYVFSAPAIGFLMILMVYPIYKVIRFSFLEGALTSSTTWAGFSNYIDIILHDAVFSTALLNTTIFTVSSVLLHLLLGLIFSLLLNQPINRKFRAVFRVILIVPWVFTAVVVAINWRLLLDASGVVNYILQSLGIINSQISWFSRSSFALPALIFVNMWRGYPFIMVSLLAGLQGIPEVLYESAKVDGANGIQQFFHITLPQLKPVILSIGLLDLIWTFRMFPLVWLTTGGGPGRSTEMLSTYTYKLAFDSFKFSKASAVGVIIVCLVGLIAFFYVRQQTMTN